MLPDAYRERMMTLLGDAFDRYLRALEVPPTKGMHSNRFKETDTRLETLFPDVLTPMPYAADGYYIEQDAGLGKHPLHHAGAYYIQDPSAMMPVCASNVREGMWVLDVCASPGGKSTQLANRIGASGMLLSNEIVPSRCATLASNGERMGLVNQIVTNTDAATLAKLYPDLFDIVVVDAPCSGEGMFRKYPDAVGEWSEGEVLACAERDLAILEDALKTLKVGGELIYATCTFSPEEDEGVLGRLLTKHPECSLLPPEKAVREVTVPALFLEEFGEEIGREIQRCAVRFYPHTARGEGQFAARIVKNSGESIAKPKKPKDDKRPLDKTEQRVWEAFVRNTFQEGTVLPVPYIFKGNICLHPHTLPVDAKTTYAYGVTAGYVEKGRVVPHHWLAMAYGKLFRHILPLGCEDPRLWAYLRGETFSCEMTDGWACVTVEGCPLGLIKVTQGIAKNHYPKGLRVRGNA